VDRPRIIIGRLGADFAIDDPEISRWHCVIEVCGHEIRLRDLDSRNGTFVGSQRIRTSFLMNDAEFRVGNSRLRLAIQPR
jgi:pSer/pThr/pTyr-binding forkhead associated (FHA) protein